MSISKLNQSRIDQRRNDVPSRLENTSPLTVKPSEKDDEINVARLGLAALLLPPPVFVAAATFGGSSLWTNKINPHGNKASQNVSTTQNLAEVSLWDGLCHHIHEGYKDYKNSLDDQSKKQLEELENSVKRIADVFVAAGEALYAAVTNIVDPVVKSVMIAAESAKPVASTPATRNKYSEAVAGDIDSNIAPVNTTQANLNVSSQTSSFELSSNFIPGQVTWSPAQTPQDKLQDKKINHAAAEANAINTGAAQAKNLLGTISNSGTNVSAVTHYSAGEAALVKGATSYDIGGHYVLPVDKANLVLGANYLPIHVASLKGQVVANSSGQIIPVSNEKASTDSLPVNNQRTLNEKVVSAKHNGDVLSVVSEEIGTHLSKNQDTKGMTAVTGLNPTGKISFNQVIDGVLINNIQLVAEQSIPRYTNDFKNFLGVQRDAIAEKRNQKEVIENLVANITEVHSKSKSSSDSQQQDRRHNEEYVAVNETHQTSKDKPILKSDTFVKNIVG